MHHMLRQKTLNFMAPFYGRGSTASRLEPLQGGSLLFTTKFPEISGTHFTDLGRMKGWVDFGATQWFWTRDPWIGNPAPGMYCTNAFKLADTSIIKFNMEVNIYINFIVVCMYHVIIKLYKWDIMLYASLINVK